MSMIEVVVDQSNSGAIQAIETILSDKHFVKNTCKHREEWKAVSFTFKANTRDVIMCMRAGAKYIRALDDVATSKRRE